MDATGLSSAWQVQQTPPLLSRRFEFASYAETRRFLDGLQPIAERAGYYPDLNFSRTHVSVSIAARDERLGEAEYRFARQTEALLGSPAN
jgi:pterin-4a-carbinolamine dehydratase